jgi:hypothetical protein
MEPTKPVETGTELSAESFVPWGKPGVFRAADRISHSGVAFYLLSYAETRLKTNLPMD